MGPLRVRDLLITLCLTLTGLALGLWRNDPLLFGLVGFLLGRVLTLDLSMRELRDQITRNRLDLSMRELRDQLARRQDAPQTATAAPSQPSPPPVSDEPDSSWNEPTTWVVEPDPDQDSELLTLDLDWKHEPAPPPQIDRTQPAQGPSATASRAAVTPPRPAPGPDPIRLFLDWFFGGNLFVRIGILLVFFGVGFLIKYAVDQAWLVFTLEMRLTAVAAGGLALLGLGWSMRQRRRDYALLLQGAGIGILYLDVYGAYQLAHLLPAGTAFFFLILIGLAAAGLAIVQDAPSLAWFGFAGGFLAPIVASSGRDDHIALFSYYAVLNAAILAVAWFKSWRALNLLGFGFTFGIGVIWGLLKYDPSRFGSTEPFLVAFFLFYVAIAVLYAVRQPPRFRGYVDATLLFGTPIVSFACQIALIRHIEYGIAWSAVVLACFYLGLSYGLPRFAGVGLKLLAQAFRALGIIFASVAIPYTFAAETTAGVWALEGAGLMWIGVRQGHPLTRVFGLLLQAGAAIALVASLPLPPSRLFANAGYLGAAMIGIGGMVSAYWLDRAGEDRRRWEQGGAAWLMIWGLSWWFGAGSLELQRHFPPGAFPANLLWYGMATILAGEVAASLLAWPRLHRVLAALPLVGLAAFVSSYHNLSHPFLAGGGTAWPMFFLTAYLVLRRTELRESIRGLAWSHAAMGLLLYALLQWEFGWQVLNRPELADGWKTAAVALIPLLGLRLTTMARLWPVSAWPFPYGAVVGGVLALSLLLWTLWSIASPGSAAPLPWLPVLNPVDGTAGLVLLVLALWWRDLSRLRLIPPAWEQDRLVLGLLGGLAFLWINLALLRALHHLLSVPYDPIAMFRSDLVQTAISILWGLLGVGLLLVARSRQSREIWMSAAFILALVVLKLFAIDLAASGTVERIVSFLAVGGLLTGMGWLSPLPPRIEEIPHEPSSAPRRR